MAETFDEELFYETCSVGESHYRGPRATRGLCRMPVGIYVCTRGPDHRGRHVAEGADWVYAIRDAGEHP